MQENAIMNIDVNAKALLELIENDIAKRDELKDVEFSIALPGGPVDGYEVFYQHKKTDPHMILMTKGNYRCFLWNDLVISKWCICDWDKIGSRERTPITFENFSDALEILISNLILLEANNKIKYVDDLTTWLLETDYLSKKSV